MLQGLADTLSSIIYPQECRVCSGEVESLHDGVACASCWAETRIFTGKEMLCRKCGAFFSEEGAAVSVSCHNCDDHHYDRTSALGVYEKALAAAILQLKKAPQMPERIKRHFEGAAQRETFRGIDLLVPVPLSRLRRLERGFNQAGVIADTVSRTSGIAVDNLSLSRAVHTPMHRIGMDQKARELTVRNAFKVVRPKLIAGRNVLLIDDVLTSGSTASQAARTLKKAGASRVDVFTLARAVMH